MTSTRTQWQPSPSAAERSAAADLGDVVARLITRDRAIEAGHSGNVIVLSPARRLHASAPEVQVGERPAPFRPAATGRAQAAALLAASLAVHAAAFVWFEQAPSPLASVGEVSMSVEIVLGTQVAAGESDTPSPSEVQSAASRASERPEAETPQTARTDPTPTEAAEIQPEAPEPQPPQEQPEPAPSQLKTKAVESEATELAAARADPQPAPPEPEPPSLIAALPPVQSVEAPVPPAGMDGQLPAPAELGEAAPPPLPQPRPIVRRAERVPERKQVERAEQTPRATRGKPRRTERGENRETRSAPASQASVASSGVGVGRSDADSNYRGRVAAHLARHKQFPAEARTRGDQGSTTVTFSIDGNGRVTSVRLARASGVSSFDRESEAMVRRASPFPAPPDGRGRSFTVPVNFHLR